MAEIVLGVQTFAVSSKLVQLFYNYKQQGSLFGQKIIFFDY